MIHFRPHHFLCTLCFQGKGYSPEFVSNYQNIADALKSVNGDALIIEVVAETDDICSPCPHKREKSCESQAKILKLDTAHAKILGLQSGERLSWAEAKARIAQNIDLESFEEICGPCNWKALGICKSVLKELREKFNPSL